MVFNGRFTTNHRLYEGVQHIFYVEHEGFVSVQFFFVKWRLNLKTAGVVWRAQRFETVYVLCRNTEAKHSYGKENISLSIWE